MTRRSTARGGLDQSGFALVTVLAVIGVTMLLIGALFGLMLTTMHVTSAQERNAREERSADAAIEAAITTMRGAPCDPTSQPYLDDLEFDQQTGGTGDDVSVDVTCSSVSAGDSATDQVRIVGGDGYNGALRNGWTVDCAVNAAAVGCMPWSGAVGSVPSGLADSATSLVHSGPEPLRFSSGVTVRTGAAALRNPTTGAPAIEVGGQYNQGSKGILGTSPTDCGMLDGDPGAGAGEVTDLDDAPGCGVAEAASVDAQPTGNTAGLVASTTVPVVPATCPASAVVSFVPGTYSAAATADVSKLTDGSLAACRNKTFHFTPGIYSFQGTELRFGDAGSYYVFGAPNGWAAGGVQSVAALQNDPDAALCDVGASGTSLVVAGWTRLTHTAGRVAICPNRPAGVDGNGSPLDPHPAIYQQTAVPTGVTVTSINRSPARNGITTPFSCRAGSFATGFDHPVNSDYPNGITGVCRPRRTYDLWLATDGLAPVTSLRVMLTGAENVNTPNNLITKRQTRFRLYNSAGGLLCQTDFVTGMPNGSLTSSFDLKAMPGTCSTTSLTQPQLNAGHIAVDHQMELGLATVVQSVDIAKAEVELNAISGRSSSVSSADWNNADNVKAADSAAATPKMPCADFVCSVPDTGRTITPAQPFVHEMTLSGFTFPGLLNSSNPDVDPSLRTLRAVVKVKPSSLTLPASWTSTFGTFISTQNFLTPGTVRMELRSPAGGRCVVQGKGMNSDQEIAFDLLDPNLDDPTASNCNTFIYENASDLDAVTLRLRFELPCVPDWLHGVPNECLRSNFLYVPGDTTPIWQIRPPDIENVQLTTVTDTYSRSETSTVTVNATGGASSSSFNVYGRTWMPLADLDINWNGPATAQPLFADDLVVHGLGSRMASGAAMGTVCCDPADSRTVELVAWIDGTERLTARVEYTDVRDVGGVPVYTPGYSADVLRWLACGAEGCASVLAATDERGP